MDKYNSVEGLLAPAREGALRPLSGRYLLKLAAGGGQLQRRQDLPEEAFYLPADEQLAKLDPDRPKFMFIALSYRWLSPGHPDPEGFHLGILSAVLKIHTRYFHYLPDVGMFWDFGSLFQKPRSDIQEKLFEMGLAASNVWYGSSQSTVWLQPHLPLGFVGGAYEQSGWCFVEASISSVIKYGNCCRLDLAKLPIDERGTIQFPSNWWDMKNTCSTGRMPPLTPDVVAQKLKEEMVFTNDSDVGRVAKLYKRFFDAVTSTARTLSFQGCGWTAQEMRGFAPTLPFFTQLEMLDLSENNLDDDGVELLAKWLPANTTLTVLNLKYNNVGDAGATALAEAVKANTTLTVLNLFYNGVGDAGATALADALKANGKIKVNLAANPGYQVFRRKLRGQAGCCPCQ